MCFLFDLCTQCWQVIEIRIAYEYMFKNSVHTFSRISQRIFVPDLFPKEFPVLALNLLVHGSKPYFKSQLLVQENDGNL